MTTHRSAEVDDLWKTFHRVVNMTSRELREWLGVQPDIAPQPTHERSPLGLAVADILAKRRVDLTVEDLAVMQRVVDVVEEEAAAAPRRAQANDERRRHRLMNVGHDPLRADDQR
ncbi:DUF3140 domain-containing protein [Phytoactinopolyspora mesophila]|uniref:DUF3140 domain-containing protein n=1 Tax=Phytoactinopolyspora mesophila TaxID=2650750 RepID=A0A7K3M564_9ACTN|nr:DUF3140 domain-containing protein [Phytoactinopolyspora mesophila]NDL58385.1 DUF3140 domain-containing protein [Phytoactinopolyspora mesophila]